MAAALAAVAGFAVFYVAASGAVIAGSTFEGNDGNMLVGGNANPPGNGTKDWAGGIPVTSVPDGSGKTDDTIGSSKEDDPYPLIVTQSAPPKDDFTSVHVASEIIGGHVFLYQSSIRSAPNGSANENVELNQSTTLSPNGVTPVRSQGDKLITFDFGGGTANITILNWNTSNSTPCTDSNDSQPCWDTQTPLSPTLAEGAVNDGNSGRAGAIAAADNPLTGAALAINQFQEMSVDLTGTGILPASSVGCETFASASIKSRSSGATGTFNSDLKDIVLVRKALSNCGTIQLKKHWVGATGTVNLNIGTTAGASNIATAAASADGDHTAAVTAPAGDYFLSESPNLTDFNASLACFNDANSNGTQDNGESVTVTNSSVHLNDGDHVICTITNTRKTGSVELRKTWSGTKGNVTLKIGTSAGGSQVDSQALVAADGTTGANTVPTGTYFVAESFDSPTSASDYTSSLACTDNGSPVTPGASDSVSVADGHTVVCTYTNTHKQGSIELKKTWSGTKGNVTLKIGTSAGGSQVDSQALVAANGTTGANTVDTGTYYVAESFDSPTNASDYASSLACTDNGQTVTPGASDSVSVADGHTVVCTYTNTRKQGSIELKKTWNGTKGNVTLKIGTSAGGSQVDSQALVAANGTTGANTVDTGTYYVAESFDSPTSASDYTSSLACTDNGSPVTPGASDSVSVADGHTVVCTYTNTRKAGSIEVTKTWSGTKGNVTLKIGTSAGGTQVDSQALVAANGTTGTNNVDTGTYYVAESFDSPTNASDYTSSLACTDNGSPVTPGASDSVSVTNGHAIVCTFTNTRKSGTIEVTKTWSGTKGNVTLKIGTSAGGTQVDSQALVAADGTTGANTVDTGTYYVAESFDSPTNASDYTSSLACTDNGSPVTPGAGSSLAVADGHAIVCAYTNTRKAGTIELKKAWSGIKGNVTLKIGTSSGGSQVDSQTLVAADGTTGANTVDTGTYYVAESFDSPTNASDYTSSLACTDNGQTVTPGAGDSLTVGNGDAVVCTYTNTRKPGSIELIKNWIGTKGDITLQIGSSASGSDVASKELIAANGTTGSKSVAQGTYYVSEVFNSPSSADDYTTTLACTDNGEPVTPGASSSLLVASTHTVVCTYTNTRKEGSIELRKTWVGDKGNVTLKIGTSAGGSQVDSQALVGADGTTEASSVDTGTYYVSESFDSPTKASDYTTTLDCTDNGEPVTPSEAGGLPVSDGHAVVCTFTNKRLPQLKLVKDLQPSDDSGRFDLSIDQQSFTNDGKGYGDGGTTGFVSIQPGAPVVSEAGNGDTSLSDYDSSISCSNEEGGDGTSLDLSSLTYGDQVTCTFTNVRHGTIEIVKHTLGGAGAFDFTLTQQDAEGSTPFQLSPTAGADDSQQFDVSPGDFSVVEAAQDGWTLTGLSCSTGGSVDESNAAKANIHIGAGDFVTCTYTNTKLATLVVKKIVDNSNGGGSKTPADFTLHVTTGGLDVPGSPAAGTSTGTTYTLLPGTYQVAEGAVSGYNLTKVDGCLADGSITLEAGQTATCTLTNTSNAPPPPPPPPPPAPRIDLQITKSATPSPATVGNQVTWTMVVTNNGPNTAHGVTVADPVPAGMTFVSATSTQGTCTGGALVNCTIGTMNVGSSVTITLVTTAAATGTITNTATTVGTEQETNTANNTASANVVVNGVFTPPVVYCTAVNVSPKQLFVGRKNTLTMKLTSHGKAKAGVKVKIKGSTLNLTTKASNARGSVKQTVKPMKAGIVVFQPVATKSCKNPRIGVIGVFTPPVTG